MSPDDPIPYIFPEEDEVGELLESVHVPTEIEDKVLAVVARLCTRISELELNKH